MYLCQKNVMLIQLDNVLCHCSNALHKGYSFKKLIRIFNFWHWILQTEHSASFWLLTILSNYQLIVNRCMWLLCFFITLEHFITLIIWFSKVHPKSERICYVYITHCLWPTLIYGIINTTEHVEVNGMMTTELERTWMKVIMT